MIYVYLWLLAGLISGILGHLYDLYVKGEDIKLNTLASLIWFTALGPITFLLFLYYVAEENSEIVIFKGRKKNVK